MRKDLLPCMIRSWITVVLVGVVFSYGCGGVQRENVIPQDPKALVSEANLVRLMRQMLQINGEYSKDIVHNHAETAEFLGKELRDIGVEVEVVYPKEPFEAPYTRGLGVKYPRVLNPEDPSDFPVVVGRLRGTIGKPVIGLTQLYNTVVIGDRELWTEDPLGGEIIEGKIYGRGATNSHASVVTFIEILRVLKESRVKLEGDLVVTLVPGEGAQEFCLPWIVEHRPELIAADWYLGGSIGPVFSKQGGHIWAKLIVIGEQHHPGRASISAVHQMAEVLSAVIDVDRWMTWQDDPLFRNAKPYVMATTISSGHPRNVAVNVMPSKVEAELDFRLLPNQEVHKIVAELNQLLDDLMEKNTDLKVKIEVVGAQKVPEHMWDLIKEDDPLVQEILAFSREYAGNPDLKMEWTGGVGGGRPDLWNLGSIVLFSGGLKLPGGGGFGAHAPDEFVWIDGLVPRTQVMVDFLQRVLNSGIRRPVQDSNN